MIRFLKEWTKQAATTFCNVHRPSEKKDILILSAPRSGSTWLMEIFFSEPGMKFINEPLGKRILDYWDFLPIETRWNYINLSQHEKEVLKEYFTTDDPIRHFGPRNPFHPDFNVFTDRRVIKTIRANALIEWFLDELPFEVIYLLRNPISQALSSMGRDHHHQIEDFIESETYRDCLDPSQLEFARRASASDDRLKKFVVEWVLDNLLPLRVRSRRSDFTVVTYEELVLEYEKYVGFFVERFGLEGQQRMLEKESRPSRTTDSSGRETREKIRRKDKESLVRKWTDSISSDQERDLLGILERFDVAVYSAGRRLAEPRFLRFQGTA